VDFCAAICQQGPLACHVFLPSDRILEGVRGYTKNVVLDFINEQLTSAIEDLAPKQIVVCLDKGLRISPEKAKEELEDGGAPNVHDVLMMPTNARKIANPLDNSLWADLKRRVRKAAQPR
jgi:hypothetical protein